MLTLRLTQTGLPDGRHHVRATLDGDGAPLAATARFEFEVLAQDREDLRWYLEEYLQYPIDPTPRIAARIEQRMAELGRELFTRIFDGRDAYRLWVQVAERLAETRVEVSSEVETDAVLPWELLWDPVTDTPLAVGAHTFVRAQHQTAKRPRLPRPADGEQIRVLLVISRPAGGEDVPFRSVASHLVRLSAEARETFQLDVLRPATFRRLAEVLREAADRGQPYHVVHFDGHGTWADVGDGSAAATIPAGGVRYSLLSPPRPGAHGYLLFEDPTTHNNQQLVDGPALGRLLAETGVPVLVLNACKSAHADLTTNPEDVEAAGAEEADVHERVRAYGSLAQEVVDAGVAGVVAMRYSVYVVTAAQFIADLYATLLAGHPLGAAVTRGRKQLREQPNREIAFAPRPLQDWVVPVVYEAEPLRLFPEKRDGEHPLKLELSQTQAGRERGPLDPGLPATPDVGFYGRDETLLALDRAFDTHQVVLLHAYAGAGKTTTAGEFARWYQLTGGSPGPVLFTSFERHRTLPQVLDQLGQVFEQQLEAQGKPWLALEDPERREVALAILRQVPVLWVWDNVEPVTGFPAGTSSEWSQAEQDALLAFLRDVRGTKAKVMLTSRRDEHAWLGELPARVALPPMPMTDRVQLARALANRHGHRLTEVEDWRPLLAYTQGNPLTVTVLVGQALRDRLRTREQLEGFVARLREGEADLADDAAQGRIRSLGASLAYGLEHAFTEQERTVVARLHLFQGFVTFAELSVIGTPEVSWDTAIGLLHRAAEVGLLTAYGLGCYGIHPALPWYLRTLFDQAIGPPGSPAEQEIQYSYASFFAKYGNDCFELYDQGLSEATVLLELQEANLVHAWELARTHGWWAQVIMAMQGFRALLRHTGRLTRWARLVEQVTPDLVDPANDGPRPGRDLYWSHLTVYRIQLAEQARDYSTAQRLQHLLICWEREQAATALAADPATLDDDQRNKIRNLSASLHDLGQMLCKQDDPGCLEVLQEGLALTRRIGNRRGESMIAFVLGHAYSQVPGVQDLAQAERWYQHSLSLHEEADRLGRSRCADALGSVHYARFKEAREAGRPTEEQVAHVLSAGAAFQQALDLTPPDAIRDLAVTHNHLGNVYKYTGLLDVAMDHYRTAIRYEEASGDRYGAATIRRNAAGALEVYGRLEDALEWARAALRDYQSYGDRARDQAAEVHQFIDSIQQAMAAGPQ